MDEGKQLTLLGEIMTVRVKFYVTQLMPWSNGGGEVRLSPVYSQDKDHENKRFWDATPNGELRMGINNPAAYQFFHDHSQGYEFYVDIEPVMKVNVAKP